MVGMNLPVYQQIIGMGSVENKSKIWDLEVLYIFLECTP